MTPYDKRQCGQRVSLCVPMNEGVDAEGHCIARGARGGKFP